MRHIGRLVSTCFVAAIALCLAACSDSGTAMNGAGKGRLRIGMTSGTGTTGGVMGATLADHSGGGDDDVRSQLKAAVVTFSSIQARATDGSTVDVLVPLPMDVDLLALDGSHSIELPAGFLPPGDYDALILTISKVHLVTQNDTQVDITPPAGGFVVMVPTQPFTVVEGQTTQVMLKFREDLSFNFGGHEIEFDPEFECENEQD